MTQKSSKPFDFSNLELLKDPEYAAIYLEECLADGNIELFQEALRDVAKAQGGMKAVAEQSTLNRESLYKALSRDGNPKMETITKVLSTLGMRLSIAPIRSHEQGLQG